MPNQMPLATLQALTVFPFADSFPYISDEETLELAQDIEANGLIHPIVLFENEILDGRNRLRAAAKTNLTDLPVIDFEGDYLDAVEFIVSANLRRRDLTAGQRAFVGIDYKRFAAEGAKLRQEAAGLANLGQSVPENFPALGSKGDARDEAGEKVGVSGRYIDVAESLQNNAPDLVEAVKSGLSTLNAAVTELKKRQDRAIIASGGTPGDRNSVADPHDRFDRLVDSKVSGLSELIAEHAPIMRDDERRKVVQCLQNLIRQAEAA